jgi:predicted SpoU family rRNA methylase
MTTRTIKKGPSQGKKEIVFEEKIKLQEELKDLMKRYNGNFKVLFHPKFLEVQTIEEDN